MKLLGRLHSLWYHTLQSLHANVLFWFNVSLHAGHCWIWVVGPGFGFMSPDSSIIRHKYLSFFWFSFSSLFFCFHLNVSNMVLHICMLCCILLFVVAGLSFSFHVCILLIKRVTAISIIIKWRFSCLFHLHLHLCNLGVGPGFGWTSPARLMMVALWYNLVVISVVVISFLEVGLSSSYLVGLWLCICVDLLHYISPGSLLLLLSFCIPQLVFL